MGCRLISKQREAAPQAERQHGGFFFLCLFPRLMPGSIDD